MKILQVGSGLHGWAGIEKYVVYLREGLAERGHEVTTTVAPGTALAGAIGGRTIQLSVRSKMDLRAFSAYLRLFRTEKFDIVHTHFNPDFLLVAYAARIAKGPRLVMTRHVALPWARWKANNFTRLYDRIIPVSEAASRRLLASGVPADKMRVAKAGCPPLAPSEKLAALRDSLGPGFKVGYVGRLTEEKGIRVLLESAELVSADMSFHVFGDGPLSTLVEQAARTNPRLRAHGFRTDIAHCMSAVDVLVIPSVWEEAFPYAALEAMSLGLPIVASDIGGLPELVQNNSNGVLFPAGAADWLASTLDALASDRALTARLGEKGREIQREEYTVAKMAERIEAVYRDLLVLA